VRALVEGEVVIAPARHARMPFEGVRREVEVLELDLLLDRLRVLVVHRAHVRDHRHLRVVGPPTPLVPGIDSVTARPVARSRDRLAALPEGQ